MPSLIFRYMHALHEQSVQAYSLYLTPFPIPITPLIDLTGIINADAVSDTPLVLS